MPEVSNYQDVLFWSLTLSSLLNMSCNKMYCSKFCQHKSSVEWFA